MPGELVTNWLAGQTGRIVTTEVPIWSSFTPNNASARI